MVFIGRKQSGTVTRMMRLNIVVKDGQARTGVVRTDEAPRVDSDPVAFSSDDDVATIDRIVLLESVPKPASGSTEPFIVASERQVALSYRIAECDFERFGPFHDDEEPFCVLSFPWAVFHRLGPPGDERLGSHSLAALGLTWYSVH